MLTLDFINTVAFAGLVLFAGHGVRRWRRCCRATTCRRRSSAGCSSPRSSTAARSAASDARDVRHAAADAVDDRLLHDHRLRCEPVPARVGGPQVVVFTVLCTHAGRAAECGRRVIAVALGLHPLFGVLNGSVTLTGGPATGLAFAPLFEAAGVPGAATVAVAAAMAGIISGGLIGGPIGHVAGRRHRLASAGGPPDGTADRGTGRRRSAAGAGGISAGR